MSRLLLANLSESKLETSSNCSLGARRESDDSASLQRESRRIARARRKTSWVFWRAGRQLKKICLPLAITALLGEPRSKNGQIAKRRMEQMHLLTCVHWWDASLTGANRRRWSRGLRQLSSQSLCRFQENGGLFTGDPLFREGRCAVYNSSVVCCQRRMRPLLFATDSPREDTIACSITGRDRASWSECSVANEGNRLSRGQKVKRHISPRIPLEMVQLARGSCRCRCPPEHTNPTLSFLLFRSLIDQRHIQLWLNNNKKIL